MKKDHAKLGVNFDTPKTLDSIEAEGAPHLKAAKIEPFCFLNVFKPKGITSFDVIYKLRKILGIKKIGHSGTLDPLAEGVMQVAVGRASRLLDYLGSDKKYIAKIKFGYISETGDTEGDISFVNVPNFTYDELLSALNSMIGQIEQTPPLFSAVKVGGKKLCDLARKSIKNTKTSKKYIIEKAYDEPQNISSPAIEGDCPRVNQTMEANFPLQKNEKACQDSLLAVENKSLQDCQNFYNLNKKSLENQNLLASPNKFLDIKIPKRNVTIYDAKILSYVTISESSDKNLFDKCSSENVQKKLKNSQAQISEVEIEIFCSKGTYIRSFAVDLAAKLNTGAYLTSLVRTQAGNFTLENSIKIEDADLSKNAISPLNALNLPIYNLNEEQYKKVLNGVSVECSPHGPEMANITFKDLHKFEACSQNAHQSLKSSCPCGIIFALVYQNTLVSIGILVDNKIVIKKVFK